MLHAKVLLAYIKRKLHTIYRQFYVHDYKFKSSNLTHELENEIEFACKFYVEISRNFILSIEKH